MISFKLAEQRGYHIYGAPICEPVLVNHSAPLSLSGLVISCLTSHNDDKKLGAGKGVDVLLNGCP